MFCSYSTKNVSTQHFKSQQTISYWNEQVMNWQQQKKQRFLHQLHQHEFKWLRFAGEKISFLHLPETLDLSKDEGLGLGPLLLNDMKRCWQKSSGSLLSRKVCMKTLKPSKSISWKPGQRQSMMFVMLSCLKWVLSMKRVCWCVSLWEKYLGWIETCYVTDLRTNKDCQFCLSCEYVCGSSFTFRKVCLSALLFPLI